MFYHIPHLIAIAIAVFIFDAWTWNRCLAIGGKVGKDQCSSAMSVLMVILPIVAWMNW